MKIPRKISKSLTRIKNLEKRLFIIQNKPSFGGTLKSLQKAHELEFLIDEEFIDIGQWFYDEYNNRNFNSK